MVDDLERLSTLAAIFSLLQLKECRFVMVHLPPNKFHIAKLLSHLTQDIRKEVRRIAEFLEVSLNDDDLEKIVHGGGFNTMKNEYEQKGKVNHNEIVKMFRKGHYLHFRLHAMDQ